MNRRNAVRRAAGLAVGGGIEVGRAAAQDAKPTDRPGGGPVRAGDPALEQAAASPFPYLLAEEAVFGVAAAQNGHEVVFPNARGAGATGVGVRLRSSSVVVFRAVPDRDDLTRQGGVYWQCGKAEGRFRFEHNDPLSAAGGNGGPLVMAVRDGKGTVRCYRLEFDFRC